MASDFVVQELEEEVTKLRLAEERLRVAFEEALAVMIEDKDPSGLSKIEEDTGLYNGQLTMLLQGYGEANISTLAAVAHATGYEVAFAVRKKKEEEKDERWCTYMPEA